MSSITRRSLLLSAAATATLAVVASPLASAQPAPPEGPLTMEWLGWSHFRFTTPGGKVVLIAPFAANPDSPVRPEDITRADLILVPNGHADEVGSTVDIATRTGATVLASGGVNSWLIEQGVPQAQVPSRFAQPGSRFTKDGIRIRLVENVHGSEIPQPTAAMPYGGVAAGFMITFENNYTAYFAGSTPAMAEQALWAQMYQPNLAILHMGGDHEPLDVAWQAKLLLTDNPNLKLVVPHHQRVSPPAGQTTIGEVQAAMDALGLGLQMTQPGVGAVVTLTA